MSLSENWSIGNDTWYLREIGCRLWHLGSSLLIWMVGLISAWMISNYIHYKVWDEITYPLPKKFGHVALQPIPWLLVTTLCMITSCNGNISALLALCAGIHRSPVNFPHKGQWRGALMFILICALNKRLSKQSWGCWFETPSRFLWRHCNGCLWNRFEDQAPVDYHHFRRKYARCQSLQCVQK